MLEADRRVVGTNADCSTCSSMTSGCCFPACSWIVLYAHCSLDLLVLLVSLARFLGWRQILLMRDFENEVSLAPDMQSLMKGASSRLRRLQVCDNTQEEFGEISFEY